MALVIPALAGKMGSTDYYLSKMLVRELLQGVRPAGADQKWWEELPAEERMQRDADMKRVKTEIAPYIAQNADRFFGALIILIYKGEPHFESLSTFKVALPHAYKSQAEDIGFLTIDGGQLIVLDGQHRWYALDSVHRGETLGLDADSVASDEISVIFIKHETDLKTRRIFNKVNRYAKQTSRGDNILTSEDDGYAIASRRLIYDEGAPFYVKKGAEALINWKSNTLAPRSKQLTTLSALYEMSKVILSQSADYKDFDEKHMVNRPSDEALDGATDMLLEFWNSVLTGLLPYATALSGDHSEIMEMRKEDHPYSLLFKPAGQIAFISGLVSAQMKTELSLDELLARANKLRWSMKDKHWVNFIMNANGTINARADIRDRTAQLIAYLLAGDKMAPKEVESTRFAYNTANQVDPANINTDKWLPLPLSAAHQAA
jgi:DNA sulfur modification protein DndB